MRRGSTRKQYDISLGADLTGMKFGRLTVIRQVGKSKCGHKIWECKCECGNVRNVLSSSLLRNHSFSCGCLQREETSARNKVLFTKHGGFGTRLYGIWGKMIQRCTNPNNKSYDRYGARGITICDEWRDDFVAFRDWALDNGYSDDLSIDRIDDDGPYAPWNCRWANAKQQANNTRRNYNVTYQGRTRSMREWADDTITAAYSTAKLRLQTGHSPAFSFYAKPGDKPGCTLRDREDFMVLDPGKHGTIEKSIEDYKKKHGISK